ncbi:MAG TPA: right-handed parallel beta-helix repeat-containing protein [Rudaea sp.]|nr:right-handed parallel beta-helix repeat-containing protein [Rudaea sp.]
MLAAIFSALLVAHTAAADAGTVYYVRPDGGSADQCDGRHDAPYAHGDEHRACAWRHPFEALPPGAAPRMSGGDTLVIAAGSYAMGRGAPGTDALAACRADWPWDCHAAAPPSGPSPARPTRILGAGFDTGCAHPPELWGTSRTSAVLDLSGSDNLEIACLEITDHSSCIEFHNAATDRDRCARDAPPYGAWASVGINAVHALHVTLRDLDIHGLAHDGVRAGGVGDWTLERVRIVGNGWSGWNGDVGDGIASASGRMLFRDVEIAWNGCGERYPGRERFGCWGQQEGGYGDGLGTADTGGEWRFERVHVHHNTQDGIDLLHAQGATVAFREVRAEANAGNQLKATGTVSLRDSIVDGSCTALGETGLDSDDLCRALGNSVALRVGGGERVEVRDNTIAGEGDCLVILECAGGACRSASAVVSGNRLEGRLRADRESRAPCSLWIGPDLRGAVVAFERNTLRATRSRGCPTATTDCSGNVAP